MTLLPARERLPAPPRPSGDEPVYTRLVADWRSAGRTVPGEPDREWARLVSGRGFSVGRQR
ncbi:hypothetical protein [Streptacidiphilus sp. P02-A3a]|uniref:hypothetical protein n=1 Tax=Streptacidiphilus sp. P02-A3a TaxID=2704468 RepID=UPI0015F9FBD5|nr:hypothetical protein [Streptacidiphilus sp. P02-A3a]QMU68038.1 hypothetical protein GXP74_07225 [Streptacidiphilus sp. P02-A3a]